MSAKRITSIADMDNLQGGQRVADQSSYEWVKRADGTWSAVNSGRIWTSYELLLSFGPFTLVAPA